MSVLEGEGWVNQNVTKSDGWGGVSANKQPTRIGVGVLKSLYNSHADKSTSQVGYRVFKAFTDGPLLQ